MQARLISITAALRVVRRSTGVLVSVVALVLCAACADDTARDLPPLLRALAEHAGSRSTSGRLSTVAEHLPCLEADRDSRDAIPGCNLPSSPPSQELLELAAEISSRVEAQSDPEALHAAGLVELAWSGGNRESVDQAISYLAAAAHQSSRPAHVLADLAAAHIARAELTQSAADLLEAIEAASRSLEHDAGNAGARFNLALALQRFGLAGAAAEAWERYREGDPSSGWSEEAARRLAEHGAQPRAADLPTVTDPPAVARGFAVRAPYAARLFGWDEVLRSWGAAALEADSAAARRHLALAHALGEGMASGGGDRSLADAVDAIHAHAADADATHRLATAHRAYGVGRSAYLSTHYDVARAAFSRGLAADPPSSTLRSWLEVYHTGTAPPGGRARPADDLISTVDSVRHPALAGQARWLASMLLVRAGAYEESLMMAGRAMNLFSGIGESESVAGLLGITADIQFGVGARDAGYRTARLALLSLGESGPTGWTHNVLAQAAQAAAAEGLIRTALHIQEQDVEVSDALRRPVHQADALILRARVLLLHGDTAAAARDLARATEVIASMEPGQVREWLNTERRLTLAAVARLRDPTLAVAALDSVLTLEGGIRTQVHLVQAYVSRADAHLALGSPSEAIADLDSATAALDRQRDAMRGTALHIALLESARASFDRLVMLALAEGNERAALRFLERGRAYFAPHAETRRDESLVRRDGLTALSYALIGDTLITGVVRGEDARMVRLTVNRDELIGTIERARSVLELRGSHSALEADLTALYDVLVAPVADQLPAVGERVLIVADGEVAGAPFPALRNARTDRYLIEEYSLRFAASLRDFAERAEHDTPVRSALLVAPVGDERGSAALPALPHARGEVESIAPWYRRAEIRTDGGLTAASLAELVSPHDILHFAGHAIFDDRAPEQSYLALDPGALPAGGGRVTAAELERMDLSSLRLVVLSACETMRSHDGRSGGFAGFSAALLRAGAGGVVGSTWRVEDRATLRVMTEFHRAYIRSGDAADALRTAQLSLLRSDDPALAAPAAWAGFRYAGH